MLRGSYFVPRSSNTPPHAFVSTIFHPRASCENRLSTRRSTPSPATLERRPRPHERNHSRVRGLVPQMRQSNRISQTAIRHRPVPVQLSKRHRDYFLSNRYLPPVRAQRRAEIGAAGRLQRSTVKLQKDAGQPKCSGRDCLGEARHKASTTAPRRVKSKFRSVIQC